MHLSLSKALAHWTLDDRNENSFRHSVVEYIEKQCNVSLRQRTNAETPARYRDIAWRPCIAKAKAYSALIWTLRTLRVLLFTSENDLQYIDRAQ